MKEIASVYAQFSNWIQLDMKKDRVLVNRKVFSVVLWCLVFPIILYVIFGFLRRYYFIEQVRLLDSVMFLPPFVYVIYTLWPTLKEFPKTFKKGGLGSILDESVQEVFWREKTVDGLTKDLKLTVKEWRLVLFHLQKDLERVRDQNQYMTILTAVVLFFMFQFLDLGGTQEVIPEVDPSGLVSGWVTEFSQWSIQVFSLILFSALFYLSGFQFQRYLKRYLVCVERILLHEDADQ